MASVRRRCKVEQVKTPEQQLAYCSEKNRHHNYHCKRKILGIDIWIFTLRIGYGAVERKEARKLRDTGTQSK